MIRDNLLSVQNLENYNFEETKKNVRDYFICLEKLEWEWAKLNARKGLAASYDFTTEYRKQPYSPIGKDMFGLEAKEHTEEQLKRYISSYYWAKNILSETEQIYMEEYFINHKYECEVVSLLGLTGSDSNEFRKLKKSAIYKFADFLNLMVLKETGGK